MWEILNLCLVLLSLMSTPVLSESKNTSELREFEKQTLDHILDKTRYDNRIVPINETVSGFTGPVLITTNLFLREIEYVCTKKQEWKIQLTFRHQWKDPRLHYDDKSGKLAFINLEDLSRVWTPDTFISNSRSTQLHTDLKLNELVRIYPDGNVLFSTRLTSTLTCRMDLLHYPFDSQTCSILFASYGFTTDDILYQWKENAPIQISKTINLPEFSLTKFNTSYCTSKTNTGEYSCLKVDFNFKRGSSKYICEWLLPTAFLTFVSFSSFWMKPKNSTRLKFLCITLILLYLHITYINNKKSSPTVSYSTAKDCWFSTCLLFVLAAFLEYGILTIVHKCNQSTNRQNKRKTPEGNAVAQKLLAEEGRQPEENNKQCTILEISTHVHKWRRTTISSRIDILSSILFPLLFIVYIITFFCTQTHSQRN